MSVNLISTQTVGAGGVTSLEFSSIPQTYSDILLVLSLRDNYANISNDATLAVNGTTITFKQLYGTGVNVGSNNVAGIARPIVGATAVANTFGNTSIYFPNYSSSTTTKPISVDSVVENNATECYQVLSAGLYNSTSPITSVIFDNGSSTFSQYGSASLYGINRIPTATLGVTPTVDYLVVAGGGTGGGYVGGGGGAGGLLTGSAFSVASGSPITVTVGAGGAGASNSFSNGNNSTFSSVTAIGGGHGGQGGGGGLGPATSGGSGGGGGSSTASPSTLVGGAGTSGQGFAGGNSGGMAGSYPSGGGGGAAAAGATPASTNAGGGNGGAGAASTLTGVTLYYAGGGGGSNSNAAGYQPGVGGVGGGGNGGLHNNADGATITAGAAGLANTGGGGGGGGSASASGGSGVVVIRYPDTYNPPSATTGNPSVKYINGYRVYTWTASGSITF